jgi:hypothetical protein
MASEYPLGTVALYGPTDKQATKLVAAVVPGLNASPTVMKKWHSDGSDIREAEMVQHELSAFLKEHHVVRAVVTEGVVGCPHEEGVDYPPGGSCPHCPFWATQARGRASRQAKKMPGRNDQCLCGSGKKFKKCCGA